MVKLSRRGRKDPVTLEFAAEMAENCGQTRRAKNYREAAARIRLALIRAHNRRGTHGVRAHVRRR
jgi:hypothetical protein